MDEIQETTAASLQRHLNFPITAYKKENGFLGIISWNEETNDLLITSKSNIISEHSGYLSSMFYKKYSTETINKLKKIYQEKRCIFHI